MTPLKEYFATPGQSEFDVPFPYLDRSHVKVLVNGVVRYFDEWTSPARLKLPSGLSGGEYVLIKRETPIDGALVEFQDGAVLTKEDLNTAVRQLLFKQQELTALYEGTLQAARVRIGEAGGIAITPEEAADQIASMIAAHEILDSFRARIAELDVTAETLLSQSVWNQDQHSTAKTLIRTERTERADADSALASELTVIAAQVADNQAAIVTEATARATADEASATLWSLLGAKNAEGTAFVLSDSSVLLTGGTALSSRLSGIDAAIGTANAAIVDEQNARVTADAANAEAINVVSTSLGGLTSTVSTLSSSVNGIGARWGVQLNSNGYISGVVLNNDGATSDFTIVADLFRIVDNVSESYITPFVVEDGEVRINSAYIHDLNADRITVGRLNVSTLIWDGDILTNKLANNAVTRMGAAYSSTNHDMRTKTAGVWNELQSATITGYEDVWDDVLGEYVSTPVYSLAPLKLTFTGLPSNAAVKIDVTIDHIRTGSNDDSWHVRVMRYRNGTDPTQVGDAFYVRSRNGYTLTTLPFIDVTGDTGTFEYRVEVRRYSDHGGILTYANIAAIVGQK